MGSRTVVGARGRSKAARRCGASARLRFAAGTRARRAWRPVPAELSERLVGGHLDGERRDGLRRRAVLLNMRLREDGDRFRLRVRARQRRRRLGPLEERRRTSCSISSSIFSFLPAHHPRLCFPGWMTSCRRPFVASKHSPRRPGAPTPRTKNGQRVSSPAAVTGLEPLVVEPLVSSHSWSSHSRGPRGAEPL